jgi:hypothetical protein
MRAREREREREEEEEESREVGEPVLVVLRPTVVSLLFALS